MCVLEGPDLVLAALESGAEFEAVFVDAGADGRARTRDLVARAESQGVHCYRLAVGRPRARRRRQEPPAGHGDRALRPAAARLGARRRPDPGPARGPRPRQRRHGRSAPPTPSGASAVVLTGQSVDPYNPKTAARDGRRRSSASRSWSRTLGDVLDHAARAVGATLVAAVVRGGRPLRRGRPRGRAAVVRGQRVGGTRRRDDRALRRRDVDPDGRAQRVAQRRRRGVAGARSRPSVAGRGGRSGTA